MQASCRRAAGPEGLCLPWNTASHPARIPSRRHLPKCQALCPGAAQAGLDPGEVRAKEQGWGLRQLLWGKGGERRVCSLILSEHPEVLSASAEGPSQPFPRGANFVLTLSQISHWRVLPLRIPLTSGSGPVVSGGGSRRRIGVPNHVASWHPLPRAPGTGSGWGWTSAETSLDPPASPCCPGGC